MEDLKDKFPIKDTSNSNFFETWEWHFNKEKMEEEMNELEELKTVQLIINFVVVMAILAVAVTVGRCLG
jgi:hypothetical protein